MKKLLVVGGTGIIGKALTNYGLINNIDITITGIEEIRKETNINYVEYKNISSLKNQNWDCICDIFTFDNNHAEKIYETFKRSCKHFIILSSTLVYNRDIFSYKPIKSDHKKIKLGEYGGYVDHKLNMEKFWEKTNVNWTMLRPYHILGENSSIGCLPPHNRNNKLVEEIKEKKKISLYNGGRVPLNIVNPKDLAKVIVKCMNNDKTYQNSYNVVNPKEIIARDYYSTLATILGISLKIEEITGKEVWNKMKWPLTTFPHLYDISNLEKDCDFIPKIGLRESLEDAINSMPASTIDVNKRMHLGNKPKRHRCF